MHILDGKRDTAGGKARPIIETCQVASVWMGKPLPNRATMQQTTEKVCARGLEPVPIRTPRRQQRLVVTDEPTLWQDIDHQTAAHPLANIIRAQRKADKSPVGAAQMNERVRK